MKYTVYITQKVSSLFVALFMVDPGNLFLVCYSTAYPMHERQNSASQPR